MAGKLLILFIALPLLETWLLIEIGSVIGALWTIFIVIATALIGSNLVRRQGLQALAQVQASQARGETPAVPILEGAALLLAGALLVTPGFISDTLGFLLLIPPLRQRVARRILTRAFIVTPAGTPPQGPYSDNAQNIIEGEYRHDE